MSRRRSSLPMLAAALAAEVALVLLAASCLEETPSLGSLSDIGVVEGRITEVGLPVAAEIHFNSFSEVPLSATVTVQADADGWYRAELPLGRYGYYLSLDGQTAPRDDVTDTVVVGRAVRRLDLVRGRAQATIRIPAALGSESASLEIVSVRRYHHGQPDWLGMWDDSVIEDESAVFDLRLLPPASYSMYLDCDGGPWNVVVPRPGTAGTPDSLRVNVSTVAHHEFDFRPRYASISGRVSGSPQALLVDFDIDAWNAEQRGVASTQAQADGTYRLDFLNAEPVRVRARYGDIEQWYGGDDIAGATVVDVQPGASAEGVDFAGGGLTVGFEGPGVLLDNAADVVLIDPAGREFVVLNNGQNPLHLDNLRAGSWQLGVSGGCTRDPWRQQWWQNAADQAHATPLSIVAGQSLDLAITLTAGGSVSGTLVRRPGAHLWDRDIALCDLSGQPLCEHRRTFWNDDFELVGCPDGEFLLAIFLTSTPWWYPGTWERAEADTVSVVDGSSVTGLSWPLPFPYKEAAR